MLTTRTEILADGVTLHMGDCRDVLPTLPRADVVITDPPYGIAATWKGGKGHGWGNARAQGGLRNQWDAAAPDEALLEVIVAKQRQGEIGTANMMFNPALNTIWDESARFGR